VEPFLCRCLREHQRQGVQFMYECVMGMVCPLHTDLPIVVLAHAQVHTQTAKTKSVWCGSVKTGSRAQAVFLLTIWVILPSLFGLATYSERGTLTICACELCVRAHAHGALQGITCCHSAGLGKTFQSVCLLWTMLTQGLEGVPTCQRVAVICPTSLVKVGAKSRPFWNFNSSIYPFRMMCFHLEHHFSSYRCLCGCLIPLFYKCVCVSACLYVCVYVIVFFLFRLHLPHSTHQGQQLLPLSFLYDTFATRG